MSNIISRQNTIYREALTPALEDLTRLLETADCVPRLNGEDRMIERMEIRQGIKRK